MIDKAGLMLAFCVWQVLRSCCYFEGKTKKCVLLRILMIMNPHSYHREHLLYSRIGLGVFLR